VRFTVAIAINIHTPSTILRLSGFFDADDSCKNSQDEQQKPHGQLLLASLKTAVAHILFPALRGARRIAVNIAKPPGSLPKT